MLLHYLFMMLVINDAWNSKYLLVCMCAVLWSQREGNRWGFLLDTHAISREECRSIFRCVLWKRLQRHPNLWHMNWYEQKPCFCHPWSSFFISTHKNWLKDLIHMVGNQSVDEHRKKSIIFQGKLKNECTLVYLSQSSTV